VTPIFWVSVLRSFRKSKRFFRKEARYDGVRVVLLGILDGARCQVQVDIGFGDAVTPAADEVQYPVILKDFAQPAMRAYPRYTVVAEKFDALYSLGMANSRMKDYFDLYTLAWYMNSTGLRSVAPSKQLSIVGRRLF